MIVNTIVLLGLSASLAGAGIGFYKYFDPWQWAVNFVNSIPQRVADLFMLILNKIFDALNDLWDIIKGIGNRLKAIAEDIIEKLRDGIEKMIKKIEKGAGAAIKVIKKGGEKGCQGYRENWRKSY